MHIAVYVVEKDDGTLWGRIPSLPGLGVAIARDENSLEERVRGAVQAWISHRENELDRGGFPGRRVLVTL